MDQAKNYLKRLRKRDLSTMIAHLLLLNAKLNLLRKEELERKLFIFQIQTPLKIHISLTKHHIASTYMM